MKRSLVFLSVFALLALAMPALAQIMPCPQPTPCPANARCEPPPPCPPMPIPEPPIVPGVFTNPDWLRVPYHRVNVTVENQIATTRIELAFVNEGSGMAEGTFLFPLPGEALVDQLTMTINGLRIDAKILRAGEARAIYDEIVRQYRDPALLEYVGRNAIQASVFPIPPGETRLIEIAYSQVLEAENSLIEVVYPLQVTELVSRRPVDSLSVRVEVRGQDEISAIYSPSHAVAISRNADNTGFVAGYESAGIIPADDFSLFYGLANQTINVNLLTFRESANQDGFFMLLVQPPVRLPQEQIIAKDVIVVLDQSGSMDGQKWEQARSAAEYVLKNLQVNDRFNVVLFSTGWRLYSNGLEAPSLADDAIGWLRGQGPSGGTDINGALTAALGLTGPERPTTILFLTDGLATEGETNPDLILANLKAAARPNARIFTFGVGDDVDTFLLDAIVREHRGAGSYVRPSERVDEEVASLYNKISAPVLTDVVLDVGGLNVSDVYPTLPLPDLFAGTQLTLVGRYRGEADDLRFTLRGKVNGVEQTYVYDGLDFRGRAGGEAFIARLWATRRIGDLLNTIRLRGENQELVESVVQLSVRYGIITPYTSFLIEENDILTAAGRAEAEAQFAQEAAAFSAERSGANAVGAADTFGGMTSASSASTPMALPAAPLMMATPSPAGTMPPPGQGGVTTGAPPQPAEPQPVLQTVNEKTFLLREGVWTDTLFEPDTMTTEKVEFLSDAYFDLLSRLPELGAYFALGERVIVVVEGVAYEVVVGNG